MLISVLIILTYITGYSDVFPACTVCAILQIFIHLNNTEAIAVYMQSIIIIANMNNNLHDKAPIRPGAYFPLT